MFEYLICILRFNKIQRNLQRKKQNKNNYKYII